MAEWATISDADAYLANKPGTDAWFVTGVDQQAYLTTAYRSLYFDPDYTITTNPTGDALTRLQYAQIELAYFYFKNPNYEKRLNLIQQGVSSFRIGSYSENLVNNKGYDSEGNSKYPNIVADLMRGFLKPVSLFTTITRRREDIS